MFLCASVEGRLQEWKWNRYKMYLLALSKEHKVNHMICSCTWWNCNKVFAIISTRLRGWVVINIGDFFLSIYYILDHMSCQEYAVVVLKFTQSPLFYVAVSFNTLSHTKSQTQKFQKPTVRITLFHSYYFWIFL